ncbi:MAG: molybdenum cofactor biosynthesis protein [Planctomycetaceae bacterium]|nr:molybdenum cofactor biosynthesis protein [Planctomycetaceae bacterium]
MGSFRDVRMMGFASRTLVHDALQWIDAQTPRCGSEAVPLAHCAGRILATDVIAAMSVPEFARSAMDGYALRAAETTGAGDYNPLTLQLLGEAFPGRAFEGEVVPGTAVRLMTGAPLPRGADAVLPVEFAQEEGQQVQILAPVPSGKHIGTPGEDVQAGQLLLSAGRRLRPQDVAILASVGIAEAVVVGRPSVLILATGNELVAPGQVRQPYQIYDANSSMLRGLIERDGGVVTAARMLPDGRDILRDALTATAPDVILISGGSSVGAEDHAPGLVRELGDLPIHGLAMRPSSPAGIGRIGKSLVFLLPGNPVSCLCAYDFFAGRAIRQLGGRGSQWPYPTLTAPLDRKLVSAIGRLDYARVRISDGKVEPLALSGASVLSSTVRADGFVVIPEEIEGYGAGTEVKVFLYDAVGSSG